MKKKEAVVSGMGVFMALITNLVEAVKKLGGTMEQLYRLATPEGSETLEAVASLIVGNAKKQNQLLTLISGEEPLVIDECDGSELISKANDIFAWIDNDFISYGANEVGSSTGKTPVEVYEISKDSTFSQMFNSLNSDLKKMCLTQAQIIEFVKKHRKWLRTEGYATFFLFESNGEFFVASVRFGDDGLLVRVDGLGCSGVWLAGLRHRLVAKKLADTQ